MGDGMTQHGDTFWKGSDIPSSKDRFQVEGA